MASVYKRTYRDKHGRTRQAATYTVESKIGGAYRRLPGYTDLRASEELGRKIERLAALRESGEQPDAAIRAWRDSLSGKLRDKLALFGLIDGVALESQRALTIHLAAYVEHLRDGGATETHVKLTETRIKSIIDGTKARTIRELTAASISRYLADRRAKPRCDKGLSAKSSNHYMASAKAFSTWLVQTNRAAINPLAHAEMVNAKTDRRHVRRALESDEVARLLATATGGDPRLGMSGLERHWLYRLAVETGLRSNELRSLRRASFDLGDAPTVTVGAADAKNRTAATIPLRRATADELTGFLGNKLPSARIFNLPRPENVVVMLRGDLDTARAAWVNEAVTPADREKREQSDFLSYRDSVGRVADFHSLRSTFASTLLRAGVDIRTAKALMRHSSITLTADVYAVTMRGSESEAVSRLPDFGAAAQKLAATGTDNLTPAIASNSTGVRTGGNKALVRAFPFRSVCDSARDSADAPDAVSHAGNCGFSAFPDALATRGTTKKETPPTGVEPVSPG